MRDEYKKDYVGTLEKENKNLKSLLEEVMDTSCLDDMIDDGFKDRDDDEFLGHNLILRSRINEALGLSEAQKLKPLMTEEPIKFTNSNKPIKIREN